MRNYILTTLTLMAFFSNQSNCQSNTAEKNKCENFTASITGSTILCVDQDTTLLTAEIIGGSAPYSYQWKNRTNAKSAYVSITDGVYPSVTITDGSNCKARKSVQLKRIVNQKFKITPRTPSICPRGSVTLKSFLKLDYYEWINVEFPSVVISTDREYLATSPGIYRLNASITKNGTTCQFTVETKVYDLSNPKEIEEYLLENHFYSYEIEVDSKRSNPVIDRDTIPSYLDSFKPFKFAGPYTSEFQYINTHTVLSKLSGTLDSLKTVKGVKDKNLLLTDNNCLCDSGRLSNFNSIFKKSRIAVWFHQLESDKNKLYVKAKQYFKRHIPIDEDEKEYFLSLNNEILNPINNKTTEEHLRIICSNLLFSNPIGENSNAEICNIHEITGGQTHIVTPGDIPVLLTPAITDVIFTTKYENNIVAEGLLQSYTRNNRRYVAHAFKLGYFAGYYNNITATFDMDLENASNYSVPIRVAWPYICDDECNVLVEELNFSNYTKIVTDGGFGNKLLIDTNH